MRTRRSPAVTLPLLAALLLAGCSVLPNGSSDSPSLSAPGDPDPDNPHTGPKHPKTGQWYRYDMYTHCGIGTVRFADRWWKVSTIHTDIDSDVAGGRVDWSYDYTPGYMQLSSDGTVVFQTAGQPPITFVPGDEPAGCA
ncbi:hypothetical protein [Streptomyces sp. HB2AG]|uniref:hypothetical protein n=1 Tax=Streptomyces sp. HB2AG TaxID=2983400 RepID=UPI0022AA64FC|nr:hypothetical protein [Streptomyces sp. HB2AG]MCZ2524775.1 hypothetical protein [Streptomyces sp. HB2AG]